MQKRKSIKILAIETSCDDTSAAVVENGITVLSNVVSSQIDLHKKYGGVVPEIAARAHIEYIIPAVASSLYKANCGWGDIDAIAVTQGPGLMGSLIVGVNTARTLAFTKKKPLIAVNHMEGHIYANFIRNYQLPITNFQTRSKRQKTRIDQFGQAEDKNIDELRITNYEQPCFPLLVLTVSGGHTNIVYMKDHLNYKILGQTIDDAAGEAFDKVAKLLGLEYPGGPIISKLAEKGDSKAYDFPRTDLTPPPKRDDRGYLAQSKPSLDFSFSGLKTAVLKEIKNNPRITNSQQLIADVCSSFQQAVVDILIRNTANAIKMYKPKSVLLSGGVAANQELRKQLSELLTTDYSLLNFFVPPIILCTDNAAMIGADAYQKYLRNQFTDWQKLSPNPNMKLK